MNCTWTSLCIVHNIYDVHHEKFWYRPGHCLDQMCCCCVPIGLPQRFSWAWIPSKQFGFFDIVSLSKSFALISEVPTSCISLMILKVIKKWIWYIYIPGPYRNHATTALCFYLKLQFSSYSKTGSFATYTQTWKKS